MSDRLLQNDRLRFNGRVAYLVRGIQMPESETVYPVPEGTIFIQPSVPPAGMPFEKGMVDRRVTSSINYKWYNAVINIDNPMDRVNRELNKMPKKTTNDFSKTLHCNSVEETFKFSNILRKNQIDHTVDSQFIIINSPRDVEYSHDLLKLMREKKIENTETETEPEVIVPPKTRIDDFEF